MSIFYNVKVQNENKAPVIMKTNEVSYIPILQKQEDYEIGIKRFKIPTSEIDFYRIYPGKQLMGTSLSVENRNGTTNKMELTDVFQSYATLQNEYDPDTGTYYNTVSSNDDYAEYLNSALYGNITSYIFKAGNPIQPSPDINNEMNIGRMTIGSDHNGLITFRKNLNSSITSLYDIMSGEYYGTGRSPNTQSARSRKIYNFTFDLNSISGYTGNCLLSDLQIDLFITSATDTKRICLLSNFAPGHYVRDFPSLFPRGIRITPSGRPNKMCESRSWNTSNSSVVNLTIPNIPELEDIFLKYGEYYKYKLAFYVKNQSSDLTMSDFRYGLSVDMSNSGMFNVGLENNTSDSLTVMPRFEFNNITEKIQFNTQKSLFINGFALFFNDGLKNALGFDCCELKSNIGQDTLFSPTSNLNLANVNLNGGYVIFDTELSVSQAPTSYVEQQKSVFKRNYLYSIIITADNLAIQGEFEGDGKSQRKILSDFEIDPSTNFRDYLVYQPQGDSVRYYELKSSGTLHNLSLQVFYLDSNNNMKQLLIGQDFIGSIKLHFKKK